MSILGVYANIIGMGSMFNVCLKFIYEYCKVSSHDKCDFRLAYMYYKVESQVQCVF